MTLFVHLTLISDLAVISPLEINGTINLTEYDTEPKIDCHVPLSSPKKLPFRMDLAGFERTRQL